MNNNEKVIELVDRIEADFRELVAVTGEQHISAFILNGSFLLHSNLNENNELVLDFYTPREGGAIIGEGAESTTDSI